MKVLISKLFVGNTPLGLPFKETFNDIFISSVVLPYIRPKFVYMEICTMWPLNYSVEYIYIYIYETEYIYIKGTGVMYSKAKHFLKV